MVIEQAKEVLRIEAQGILNLVEKVGPEFEKSIETILAAKGRVILTGMGKSGLIARKIAATLSSTGTPSLFLHPAEAVHGDLGIVTRDDVVISISNAGQTFEIITILPILRNMGVKLIAFTGDLDSPMAKGSHIVIDVGVDREACPMGLAPTASTTAALAMGDALAVALIGQRRFGQDDFKRFHPGGSLGDRLTIRAREVMLTNDRIPMVPLGSKVSEAIKEINAKGLGATLVVGKGQILEGIISDGDLRRALLEHENLPSKRVEEIMSSSPRTIGENQTMAEALGLMELYAITHLVIVDKKNQVRGIVHLHDLLGREGFNLNGGPNSTTRTHR